MMLSGKVALVTGGSNGIGEAISRRFLAEGAKVIVCDIDEARGLSLKAELNEKGAFRFVKFDLSKIDLIPAMVADACNIFNGIDILVNNAGICSTVAIDDLDMAKWDFTYQINLKAPFVLTREVIKHMRKKQSGKIINITSIAGERGALSVSADYAASKAGLMNLTKTFALTSAKHHINVNAVSPGVIKTEMINDFDCTRYNIPLARLGLPQDVAGAVLFLASDLSDYITGSCIDVNGGLMMR